MSVYVHLVCHRHKRHVAFWRRGGAPLPYDSRGNQAVDDFIRDHLDCPMSVEDEHFFDVHGEYFDVLGPWPDPEPKIGGEPCTVSKSLPSLSGSPCSTSSGGSGSSEQAGQGDGAPCPLSDDEVARIWDGLAKAAARTHRETVEKAIRDHAAKADLTPAEQAIVDQHKAFMLSISPELWRQYP